MSADFKAERRMLFRQFLPLLAAIAMQQLLGLFVNLLDNFMLGVYSETAMSGASIVNQIQSLVMNTVLGCGQGVAVLASQYWGKGQTGPIKKVFACGLKVSFCIGLFFTLITAICPEPILRILTNDEVILAESLQYISIMCWTYVIFSVSAVLMISMTSVETAYIGTAMSASTIVINFCLNYTLIYGRFGAPELGIRGAAYATLASRCMELIIVAGYIFLIDKKLKLRPRDLLQFRTGFFKDYLSAALPTMITGAMWGIDLAAQTAILGHMSAEVIGANSIAITAAQVFLVAGYASSSASSVIMGKTVGSGRKELIRPLARSLQVFYLCLGFVVALILFLCKDRIVGFYHVSDETRRLAIQFLIVMSITIFGSVYEYPVMSGIIAGGGNTKYQAYMDNGFMWLVDLPLAFLSAFVFHWPPVVTFFFLKIDQLLKCIPNAIYCNSYRWVRNRTRAEEKKTVSENA